MRQAVLASLDSSHSCLTGGGADPGSLQEGRLASFQLNFPRRSTLFVILQVQEDTLAGLLVATWLV